jgi:plasmid stabilization system protein ParE
VVQKKVKAIVWSKTAQKQYFEILEYLTNEAPQAIDIVGNALLDMIENLSTDHNLHPPDRFKKKNDRTFKAAVVMTYRISYLVESEHVYILRIRHTSREPLMF